MSSFMARQLTEFHYSGMDGSENLLMMDYVSHSHISHKYTNIDVFMKEYIDVCICMCILLLVPRCVLRTSTSL